MIIYLRSFSSITEAFFIFGILKTDTLSSIEIIYSHFCINYSLTTDSRKVESGSVYLALKGERFDGNEFAQQALELGASLVIVDDNKFYTKDERVILVENSLETLQLLAQHHRQKLNIPVVALTGSNGKTTTKELLNEALSTKYNVHATAGNFNNHIGVPLTILKATPIHEIIIVEMGANHIKEIQNLCNIGLPDIGLITNIGKAHLEGFGGYEGVIKAKSEMYEHLKSTGGTIVYNNEDDLLTEVVGGYLPTVAYSPNSNYKLIDSYPKLSFEHNGVKRMTGLVGAYNLANIAAAISVGELMHCEVSKMLDAICDYVPTNNRSQTISKNGIHFILDAYNANPTSMELAIKEFGNSSFSNKGMVLGDMMELGVSTVMEHEKIIKQCRSLPTVDFIFVGPIFNEFEKKYPEFRFVKSVNNLSSFITQRKPDSHCLVKGSRSLRLENILGLLD